MCKNNYGLDKYQAKVLTTDNNTIIIAGAGSGKTTTITAKIKSLVDNCTCKDSEILVISFTNASVNDLKRKIPNNVNIYTFHKLAIEILKKAQVNYSLCSITLLHYIINELLITNDKNDQKAILKFLKLNISYNRFIKTNDFICFCNLIATFINLCKTNNININLIKNIKYTKKEKKIVTIILKIYKTYLIEKNSQNLYDFDDLIINATKYVKTINLKYKYIIIDEFQDTSLIRLNLIREIYNNTKSKIIVVGDDYQSIYRFSGCDLNIFLHFTDFFPDSCRIKLINTYRNSLKLINIANIFITKNPLQIKKELFSSKACDKPIILVPYFNEIKSLKIILDDLIQKSQDIIILARNNNDIYKYIDNEYAINDNIILYKNNVIKYYTIHKSKGLEAEYVIVINCNNNYLGFPNKIENNSIINKLFPNNEIKYAEERRLFYVALTRCKEKVYLLYNKYTPSIFIKEINKIIRHLK